MESLVDSHIRVAEKENLAENHKQASTSTMCRLRVGENNHEEPGSL